MRCCRAKTFAGSERVKSVRKVIQQKEKGEIASQTEFRWTDEAIAIPALPPQLCRCQIIEVSYSLEMEVTHDNSRVVSSSAIFRPTVSSSASPSA